MGIAWRPMIEKELDLDLRDERNCGNGEEEEEVRKTISGRFFFTPVS